eukprot:jgi/Mesen1/3717/ME000202S02808
MAFSLSEAATQEGQPVVEVKSHARRDLLIQIQEEVQKKWEDAKVFEAEAKSSPPQEGEKYFGNFPYPYMNGMLHLGHAFTLSKVMPSMCPSLCGVAPGDVEFAAAYNRLRGANVLFPFGFHCTGMPIKVPAVILKPCILNPTSIHPASVNPASACADRLAREVEQFGSPPQFPPPPPEDEDTAGAPLPSSEPKAPAQQQEQNGGEPVKFKGKKSKAAAKTGNAKYQWQIMQSLGISDEEILKFRDPAHWLVYFPPLAIEDLRRLGLGVDWRRSFITTDYNPYYDSFASWHLSTLHKKGKVVKDRRYTIYSPLDGQVVKDRRYTIYSPLDGQEYTLIKMQVVAPFSGKLEALAGKRVYLAAATLRPETMYGQTNAWVLPDGQYGAFQVSEDEVFVVTRRAANNMAYQFLSTEWGKPTCLLELTGHDLIGLPLKSPQAVHPVIYALPMLTILTDKGSTPSPLHAPLPLPLPSFPHFCLESAPSPHLGTGIVTSVPSDAPDDYMALQDLKSKPGTVTQLKSPPSPRMMVEKGEAVIYSEPEKKVMSRSGDECVVALTDQWYLTYGEAEWKALSEKCLQQMEVFSEETRHGFEHTLGWLDRKAKGEFEYWYPFDLRVSGKDLINNHLSFSIYNHTAMFPPEKWPRGIRCNGHLLINSEKMSKSTGNFLTIRQSIEEYSADATRFALADAGDTVDDANFEASTANAAILRLTKSICPHYGEHAWSKILKKPGFAITAGWPAAGDPDFTLKAANEYVQDTISDFRKVLTKQQAPPKKAKKPAAGATPAAPQKPSVGLTFAPDADIMSAVRASPIGQRGDFKKVMGLCMPFMKFKQNAALQTGPQALDLKLTFDEVEVLTTNADLIRVSVAHHFADSPNRQPRSARGDGSPVAIFVTPTIESEVQARLSI